MAFTSELETPAQRFISICLQHALGEGWVSADDFVVSFPPRDLMNALEAAPELRARLLVEAAGVHERIAPRKSTDTAIEDLNIALSEGLCDAAKLLSILSADDQVRYLEGQRLWSFMVRDGFWSDPSPRGQRRLSFVLRTALAEGLVSYMDFVDGVGAERLAAELPKSVLERAFVDAVNEGRARKPFGADALFSAVPLEEWVTHVPLSLLWSGIVERYVAPACGLVGNTGTLYSARLEALRGRPPSSRPPSSRPPSSRFPSSRPPVSAPPPVVRALPHRETLAGVAPNPIYGVKESDVEALLDSSLGSVAPRSSEPARDPAENVARQRAQESLCRIGRLPPDVDQLATATLLAIDSMYSELLLASTDQAREECIRDAFPNPQMLREALVAIARSLDPLVDASTLLARGADDESLIKLVLFEERRRSDRTRRALTPPPPPPTSNAPPRSKSSRPPPPPPGTSQAPRSVPPPAPSARRVASSPPPMPPPLVAPPPPLRRRSR